VNDFYFENVKRYYTITHPDTNIICAWLGHQQEKKYFFITKGNFQINLIKIDNWQTPSKGLQSLNHTLSGSVSEILIIPPCHVNDFRALKADSTIIIFSDMLLEDSKNDDFRFPCDY
jgi:hypothetical protein